MNRKKKTRLVVMNAVIKRVEWTNKYKLSYSQCKTNIHSSGITGLDFT